MNRLSHRIRATLLTLLTLLIAAPATTHAAASMPSPVAGLLPNSSGKSLTTPTAWGASGGVLFIGAGGTTHLPHSQPAKGDGAFAAGFGLGNPLRSIGIQTAVTVLDIQQWSETTASFHLFREFSNGGAAAIGAENLSMSSAATGDPSYYIVYSQGAQSSTLVNPLTGTSKLHVSIGLGSGRFARKTQPDIDLGRGENGTVLFGNLAYDLGDSFNFITDWNGTNLNAGISTLVRFGRIPLSVSVGIADLTDRSGDGARFIFAGGYGFTL